MADRRFCQTCDTLNVFNGFESYSMNTQPPPCKQCGNTTYAGTHRPHSKGRAAELSQFDINALRTDGISPLGINEVMDVHIASQQSREALMQLMAKPDPQDLPPRGHYVTQEGSPRRFELLSWLPNVYTQYQRGDAE